MTNIINLQNSTLPENIVVEPISFESNGFLLRGTIYKTATSVGKLEAVIVTGAWTTVKEQMPATYAVELAKRGLLVMTFDFTGWGQSEGKPRYVEDPKVKTADIHAAVNYLTNRDDIDTGNINGLGVCASSGYMAEAVANNDNFQKLVLVAPWLHDADMAMEIYGGNEVVSKLIAASEEGEKSDNPSVLTAASVSDETAPMYQAPYYTEEARGLISEYDNKFSTLSWKPWLTYDGQASADRIEKPILMVGSAGIALPAGAEAYEKRANANVKKVWLDDDVNQFDFYDRADVVKDAADAAAEFFKS